MPLFGGTAAGNRWGCSSRGSTAAQRATADGKPTLNRPQPELGGRLRVSQRRDRYINRNMYLLSRVGCRQSFTGTNMLDGAAVTHRTSMFKRRYLESTRSWLRPSGSTSAGSGEAVAGVACISSYVTASTAGNTAVGSLKVRNPPTFARSFTARSTKPPPSTTNGSKWSGGAPTLVGAALLFAGGFFGAQLLNGAGPSSDNVSNSAGSPPGNNKPSGCRLHNTHSCSPSLSQISQLAETLGEARQSWQIATHTQTEIPF